MRIKLILISYIVLLQFIKIGFCQPVYFNNIYHLGDPSIWSGAVTFSKDDDGYIICGKTGSEIGIIKLNEFGEQVWSKTWGDSLSTWYTGYPGSLQSINDQHYLAGSKNFYSRIRQISFIMHFDSNWDTTWTKEYDLDYNGDADTGTLIQNMAICDNNDLILTGLIARSDLPARFLLMRCDSSGTMLWHKVYYVNQTGVNNGYSVIQTSDGGFAMGGYYYRFGNNDTGDPIILKTDSLGNKEWLKNLGGPYPDYMAMLCLANDSNILMGTTIADYSVGGTANLSIHVEKLDYEGNILWNKKYGPSLISNYLSNIRTLDDGSIVCVGSSRSEIPWNSGWILKLNSDGDSLWYREYYILPGGGTYNLLKDIMPTDDSGLISCGMVSPTPPDPGIESAWVIKLDSIGCEFAGCDTTVGIEEEEIGRRGEEEKALLIYPNPAKNIVNCQLSTVDYRDDCKLLIYDIYGRTISTKTVTFPQVGEGRDGGCSWQIDVSNLPQGIYLVVVQDQRGRRYTGKFVVSGR